MSDDCFAYEISGLMALKDWDCLVSETSKVFRMTKMEAADLYNNMTAKIIAAIPYAADCIEPERTAVAHLCLYMAEKRGFRKFCSHLPSDDFDIFNRLAFISTYEGGDKLVIEHGMNMLAFIMLEGYKNSSESDKRNNIYNPLVSGKWNYEELKTKIERKLNEISVPDLDFLFYSRPKMFIW